MGQGVGGPVKDQDRVARLRAGLKNAIKIPFSCQTKLFGKAFRGCRGIHAGISSLIELGIGDQPEKLLVALKPAELLGQLFHRVDRIHRI